MAEAADSAQIEFVSASTTGARTPPGSDGAIATPKTLLDLPHDIHSHILSFVVRPTDQVSLCLTCKHFHEIVVRQLYKVVELDLGGEKDERLPAFLSPDNIGVKWIREVELYMEHHEDKYSPCNFSRQANFSVKLLLQMLPRNQLELFRWHPWEIFSADNMVLLLQKQKRLKWVGAIGLDKPWNAALEKQLDLDSSLAHTKKLGLYPDTRDSLEFCQAVLKRVKSPDKITLHCNFDVDDDAHDFLAEVNDTATESGLLTRTMFRHMQPFEKCIPMALRAVTLEGVILRYCVGSYCKVIDFTKVQKLSICHCKSSDGLLAALCHSTRLPEKLEKFEFKNDDDDDECEVTSALDTFLCLVSGIKILTLDVCATKRLPTAMSIVRHAKTLEMLNAHAWKQKGSVHVGPWTERIWELEAFERITKACKRIEQLSIAFPLTFIGRENTEEYDAFVACLGHLPNLVTCNITTWPQNKNASSSYQPPRKMYESLLCAEAQEGFETSIANAEQKAKGEEIPTDPREPRWTHSKLRVIAFGVSDRVFDPKESQKVCVFVRGQSLDPMGGTPKVQAMRLDLHMLQYFESSADIMGIPISHQPAPPTSQSNAEENTWD